MPSRKLVEYVRENLKKSSEKEVRDMLIKEGYPKELADSAIKAAFESNQEESNTTKEKKEKDDIKAKEDIDGLKKKIVVEKKSNSKWLILVLIVILIGIVLFIFYSNKIRNTNDDSCIQINNKEERDNCYLNRSLEEKDVNICNNKIESNDLKKYCVGVINLDSSLCDNIEKEQIKDWCYIDITVGTKGISGIGNEELCYKVEDINLKSACIGIVNLDSSSCELIEDGEIKDWCYEKVYESGIE